MKQFSTFTKRATLISILVLCSVVLFSQTRVKYDNSWGKQGITINKEDKSGLVLTSSVNSYSLTDQTINKSVMQTLNTPGVMLPNDAGAPNLPVFSSYIAIPQGAKVKVSIKDMITESVSDIAISPAPIIPKDDNKNPLVYSKNQKIYSSNQLYPNEIVSLSKPMKIRGVDVVLVGVSPFQYNPVTKELVVNRDIQIEIEFDGGNGQFGDNRLRSRWWDPIIKDAVLNNSSIPEINNKTRNSKATGCEYLIIVPDDDIFIKWADSLKIFRNQQGILTNVVTTTEVGGNTVSAIENYIDDAYNNWDIPPAACLLMADYGNSGNTIMSPTYDDYCVSDNMFADVDGDYLPEVVFARMTAQTEEHLETFVTKVLNYERNPPTSPEFYDHPITALGWQTERWFQICSEAVGGFFKNSLGKHPVRINEVYDGNPMTDDWSSAPNTEMVTEYFGPNGLGYITASPSELGNWTGGNDDDVNNAINNGAFVLQHRDHGGTSGWGEPSYNSSDINSLYNEDLVFVFSINCLTGKYNNPDECFAEKFHRHTKDGKNAGALGLIAASEVSYSFVNDTYVWGLFDNMWTDFMPDYGTTPESRDVMPAFGNAAGKYFLEQSSWPYNTNNKEVTYNLFHHHGDAFSTVYSEVPQNLTIMHDPVIIGGSSSFYITADEDALIALTVNNEIIATGIGTGSQVEIVIEPQYSPTDILVTVTKQNYYRYQAIVDVISPDGAYVIFDEVFINNTSGMLTTGETEEASMHVKNVGLEDGENISVTISTEDPYIQIIDNTLGFGDIPAGATASNSSYSWEVANNIPDMHNCVFDVQSTDGTEIWNSKMFITAHAPSLSIGNLTVDDSEFGNNDGQIDIGETVKLIIESSNKGSYLASDAMGFITSTSPFVSFEDQQFTIGNLNTDATLNAEFTVTISESTPMGSLIEFNYELSSGEYEAEKSFTKKAGTIVEDWETGDMTKFEWTTGGGSPWNINTNDPFEGVYDLKSGAINDQQTSWLSIIYESSMDDSISFYAKVSSEDDYDFLKFSIDGAYVLQISGEVDWKYYSFAVTADYHMYRWEYTKDANTTGGDDCAFVDFITLPTPYITSVFAGNDAELCQPETINCEGIVSNCETVLWQTIGTGTFVDSEIENAVYTPSAEDIAAGMVKLYLTGYGSVTTLVDTVEYTFVAAPIAIAGGPQTICSTTNVVLDQAYAENYTTIEWSTNGDGSFDDHLSSNPIYTPGIEDINNGNVVLTLTAIGSEACGNITDEAIITIERSATITAGADADICPMLTYTIDDATAADYETIKWTTSGDGTFNDAEIANPTYTPGENDKITKEVTLTLTATNAGICPSVIDDMLLTLHCTDIAEASENIGLIIFPNPNKGNFSISMNNAPSDIVDIVIYNAQGMVVYQETNTLINSDFSSKINMECKSGIYTIRISGKKMLINSKFVIR